MTDTLQPAWADWTQLTPGLPALEWALLLAVAAVLGHLAQRYARIPKIIGYAVVGAITGLAGFAGAAWPLHGVGLFLLELGIAVVLFEAGARLPLRWFRHNPMVLVQSAAESLLTFMAAFALLRWLGLDIPVVRALSVIAMAASPAVLMRVVSDLRASGPVTDRSITLTTLNALYALTIGTAMLRSIDRADSTLLASMAASAAVLGVSILIGAILAGLLAAALRYMSPTSEDTTIVMLALIGACAALAPPFGGSAPLVALLGGIVLKQIHPRPWVWPRQLGTAASMLNILMFVLVSSMAAQAEWTLGVAGIALALIVVRALAKTISLAVTGLGTGISLKKSVWVSGALVPMSSVALLLTSQFVAASHTIGSQVANIALPVILITELLGAMLVTAVLYRAGETSKPRSDAGVAGTEQAGGKVP